MRRHTRRNKWDVRRIWLLLKSFDYAGMIGMIAEIVFIVCAGILLNYKVSSYEQQKMEDSLNHLLTQSTNVSQEEQDAFLEEYTTNIEEQDKLDLSTYESRLEEITVELEALNLQLSTIDQGYEPEEVRSATGGAFHVLMSGGDEGIRSKEDAIFQQIDALEAERADLIIMIQNKGIVQDEEQASNELDSVRAIQASAVRKFQVLLQVNTDFYGWLTIPGTVMDLPVVSTADNDYYLHRDFYGKDSRYGTLFLDSNSDIQTPSHNLIIYGHNMTDGSMFHGLLSYRDESFYEDHKQFTLDTIYGKETYEVVAAFYSQVFRSDEDVFKYYKYTNPTSEEMETYLEEIQKLSRYDTGVECTKEDYYITLSTCAYQRKNGRFVVVGKKVEES